jgi:AraC-like DNA-binding protein
VDTQTLAPEVSRGQFLRLYLLIEGQVGFSFGATHPGIVKAPSVIVCRADLAHALGADPGLGFGGLLCANAFLDGPVGALLFREFAEPLVISPQGSDDPLNLVIQLIACELHSPRCGQPALLNRAGDILFIALLRHLIAHPTNSGGLFNGLADQRIARALVAMHSRPQAGWTLESLSEEAGMSRTSFANLFRVVMSRTPGKYLRELRLAVAQKSVKSGLGLKRAAKDSGYLSASALSRSLARSKLLKPG